MFPLESMIFSARGEWVKAPPLMLFSAVEPLPRPAVFRPIRGGGNRCATMREPRSVYNGNTSVFPEPEPQRKKCRKPLRNSLSGT